jgi:hypothetical protein
MDTETKSKIKIGATYQRPANVEIDPDMIRLQKALLGEKPPFNEWLVWLALVAVLLVALFLWRA